MKREQIVKGNVTLDIVLDEAIPCRPVEIRINGVKANFYDLGMTKDIDPDAAPPCGCGKRVFIPKEIKGYGLTRYKLTPEDAEDLKSLMKERFSVGFCRRCK